MRHHQAFTLIELLVVISIIAVLAGMLLPAVSAVRDLSKQSSCANNQRQFMMAVIAYVDDWDGRTPMMESGPPEGGRNPNLTLMKLGYLPTENMISSSTYTGRWEPNPQGILRWPNTLQCPANRPERILSQATAYGFRWTTDYAATGQPNTEMIKNDTYLLSRANPVMPLIAEAFNPNGFAGSGLISGINWHNTLAAATAGWFDGRMGRYHRNKAVAAWKDGHVAVRTVTQLVTEDRVLGSLAPP
jgi:prepilin-type N-terminal cleavage/methylation domain-containing protein